MNISLVILGIVIGVAGTTIINKVKLKVNWNVLFKNLDKVMLVATTCILAICIIVETLGFADYISLSFVNIYSSIIFSWLLTKFSAETEFKKKEEDMAKLSFRHLGDVEKTILTAEQKVRDFITGERLGGKLDGKLEYFLEGVIDKIELIKIGIATNKEDWFDMLAEGYKGEINKRQDPEAKCQDEIARPSVGAFKVFTDQELENDTSGNEAKVER